MNNNNIITVYEHETIQAGEFCELGITEFKSLQQFYGKKGVPFFSLGNNCITFNQYVGVLQVGDTVIEVLPKAEKGRKKDYWRKVLIDMLRVVGVFKVHTPSNSSLQLKANSILELYFELYVQELEYLLHHGLIKRYKKETGNKKALKGRLLFGKHIQKNIVHQERFYVRYTTYSKDHLIHQILYKALKLVRVINNSSFLKSRIGALLLNFPEVPDIKVIESTFDKINYNRKNEHYQKALDIAKLILLNYHPDLMTGKNDVLALMFDMNILWEKFVYESLRKRLNQEEGDHSIRREPTKTFWQLEDKSNESVMSPDIVLKYDGKIAILDTKWKNINGGIPSAHDLRQMYAYLAFYGKNKIALVYPNSPLKKGVYMRTNKVAQDTERECSIIGLKPNETIHLWQDEIFEKIKQWIET